MSAYAPKDEGIIKEQLEELASVLDQHNLSHLEYDNGHTHIIIKKERAQLLGADTPSVQEQACLAQEWPTRSPRSFSTDRESTRSSVQRSPEQTFANKDAVQGAGDLSLLAHNSAAVSPTAANEVASTANSHLITAPLVGLAYRAKEPSVKPFVALGDKVKEGSTLCLIEAMKMFNEIKATHAGTISKIHFVDGELVEFGAPLFSIQSTSLDH